MQSQSFAKCYWPQDLHKDANFIGSLAKSQCSLNFMILNYSMLRIAGGAGELQVFLETARGKRMHL